MKAQSIGLFLALTVAVAAPAQERDPKAEAVMNEMLEALGGASAWDDTRYVRFDFRVGKGDDWRVDRAHLWDKWEGRYRFEATTEDGEDQVALFNVNQKAGEVYVDGEPLSGEAKEKALSNAYGAFINDSYWLAMPWKWRDEGVNLAYGGEAEHDGMACDVVELSFGDVGLTPGDRYKAYVSKDSRLMIYWEYTLQSDRTGSWDWEYVDVGGLKLAKTHVNDEGMEINMGDVATPEQVDDAMFTDLTQSLR